MEYFAFGAVSGFASVPERSRARRSRYAVKSSDRLEGQRRARRGEARLFANCLRRSSSVRSFVLVGPLLCCSALPLRQRGVKVGEPCHLPKFWDKGRSCCNWFVLLKRYLGTYNSPRNPATNEPGEALHSLCIEERYSNGLTRLISESTKKYGCIHHG